MLNYVRIAVAFARVSLAADKAGDYETAIEYYDKAIERYNKVANAIYEKELRDRVIVQMNTLAGRKRLLDQYIRENPVEPADPKGIVDATDNLGIAISYVTVAVALDGQARDYVAAVEYYDMGIAYFDLAAEEETVKDVLEIMLSKRAQYVARRDRLARFLRDRNKPAERAQN